MIAKFWSEKALEIDPNAQLPYIIEFFLPSQFQHGDPGAWPPLGTLSPNLSPVAGQWSWTDSDADEWFINAVESSIANLARIAREEGLASELPRYSNYAITGTPITAIWGESNIARLQKIKAVYDPDNVMGLAGGFKIPSVSS